MKASKQSPGQVFLIRRQSGYPMTYISRVQLRYDDECMCLICIRFFEPQLAKQVNSSLSFFLSQEAINALPQECRQRRSLLVATKINPSCLVGEMAARRHFAPCTPPFRCVNALLLFFFFFFFFFCLTPTNPKPMSPFGYSFTCKCAPCSKRKIAAQIRPLPRNGIPLHQTRCRTSKNPFANLV
jgi:hypothetical protein